MKITQSPKVALILLVAAALAVTVATAAVVTVNQNVGSSGTITTSPNIGVYSDSNCSNNMTSISWGSIAAGGTASQTVYVKNTGTGTMTLSMTVSGWNPSNANNYMAISWNQAGTQLSGGQSVAAIITLTVYSNVTGISSFSNTIQISGTG